jgi:hypothetical protein
MSYWMKFVSGGTAGAIGQFCASPCDVVKIRLQAQASGRAQFGYKGACCWRRAGDS